MAGHSKWAKIHRGKAVEDAKRGAIFTKLGNSIAIAAKNGSDPDMNFSLRLAIDKAKSANMPIANIQRAIDRGSGKLGGEQIQEVMYEGYGPGGVGILVLCATDNVNRTYPDVRLAFSKHGGNVAEKGSVSFQFDRKGVIEIKGSNEDILLTAIEVGATDVEEDGDEITVYTDPKDLTVIRDRLVDRGVNIEEAGVSFVSKNIIKISDSVTAGKIERLMEALDALDDVTDTYVNFDITDS